MRAGIVVNVTRADRHRLEAIVSDRCAPQKHVWRAQILLATAAGCGTAEIMRRSGKAKPVVWTWQARFMEEGVDGLLRDKTRKPGKAPLPAETVQLVIGLVTGPPPGEATHWTGRMLAKAAGVSLRSVQRILEAHQLAPHRIRTFKLSTDPKFGREVHGCRRPLRRSSRPCGCSLGRRKEPNPGARSYPAGAADEAGPRRDDDARLQTSRHHHAVRSPQHPRWDRHWPQHAAPSPSRVHPLPQYDRGAGPRGKGDPRRRRQLCDPQASKGAPMAGAASPLEVPLHPDLSVLAQCGRRLLCQTHASAPPARRVPIRR